MGKNILVLGGAGYIGSHAVLGLKKSGYNPVVYDNLSTGHKEAARGAKFIEADIADVEKLKKVLRDENIDAVMHFAASALVGESMEDPLLYFDNNVCRAVNLFKAMIEVGVKRVIFSSTAATYGTPERVPIEEDDKIAPINPYGESKVMIEKILKDCKRAYGLNYVIFRYFNAAGADQTSLRGEVHDPETHLIPIVLQTALGQRKEVKIFGTDYNTPDGTCVRDYIHVTDLIDAHILALGYLEKGSESTVFNLGNNNGFSVREVIETARKVCGKEIPAVEAQRREGDPDTLIASSKKAKKVLGWNPKISSLEEIIESAWNWHKTFKEGSWPQ